MRFFKKFLNSILETGLLIRGHFDRKKLTLVLAKNTKDFHKIIKGKKFRTCFSKYLFLNVFFLSRIGLTGVSAEVQTVV